MTGQTLEELKAENAAKTNETEVEEVEQLEEEQQDEIEQEEIVEDATEEESETEEEEVEEESEVESWMQGEEATHEDNEESGWKPNKEFAAKRKNFKRLKGELQESKDEIAELKAQIEQMQTGSYQKPPEQEQLPPRPTREQFDYDDDAYDKAVDEWNDKKLDLKLKQHSQKSTEQSQQEQAQLQQQQAISKAIESHYDRAAKLVDDGKVSEDNYRAADQVVRMSFETMFPQQGEQVTNAFIAGLNELGEGSEKVMYMLGKNPSKLSHLQGLMQTNPAAASMYAGKLLAEVTTPTKRKSSAPKPAKQVNGEGVKKGPATKMHRAYKDAGTDIQKRLDIKREAKRKGVDVSNW